MAWPQDAYVGQKVVRVLDPNEVDYRLVPNLVLPPKHLVVTVSWVGVFEDTVLIDLVEYPENSGPHRGYIAEGFRPAQRNSKGFEILAKLQDPTNHRDLEDVAPNSPVPEGV